MPRFTAIVRKLLPASCLLILCLAHARAGEGPLAKPVVYRSSLQPHWLADGRMWYEVDTGPGAKEWVLVQPDGALTRFADRERLQAALGGAMQPDAPLRLTASAQPAATPGPSVELLFRNRSAGDVRLFWLSPSGPVFYALIRAGAEQRQQSFAGHVWQVQDAESHTLGYATTPSASAQVEIDAARVSSAPDSATSPDGKWTAFARDDNVWLRPAQGQGEPVRLSSDGNAGATYRGARFFWSPDSSKLVAFRAQPSEEHMLNLVSAAKDADGKPLTISFNYLRPGDRIAHPRPVLFDVAGKAEQVLPDELFPNPWGLYALGESTHDEGVTWAADSSRFFFAYNQRGHQLMRVIVVDTASATPATLFEDSTSTFIDYQSKYWARYLAASDEILWMSERDGWNHLYVHDAKSGRVKRRLTQGEWQVLRVEAVDEQAGTLVARVSGRNRGEDPYNQHEVRIALADGAITPLTVAEATHDTSLVSPDGSRYIDRYSRIDLAPMHELRRSSDGKLLATLERADASALRDSGWKPPERFVAKGRDGKTDIWGMVVRPSNFDPARRYPVIEQIYAGPHGCHVPTVWGEGYNGTQQIADRGFIVVQIDGMGTNCRSKAFHDVAYKNLKDAGFPDRIGWIRALAAKYPRNLDLERVGIFGVSAGGQNAVAALLWHGDFYKVAAADSGPHDNRMDKVWWNELWMGYPVDHAYDHSSNIVHAAQLRGKLLLSVGDLDTNVDPAATLELARALTAAGKEFELAVFPGAGHSAIESPEGRQRRIAFFEKYLLPHAEAAPAARRTGAILTR